MSNKAYTQSSYQATAEEYARNVANLAPTISIEKFCTLLPPQGVMVDIGCGSGRDAQIFSEKGLKVLGVDFCSNLLEIARKTAPLAQFQLLDIEETSLPTATFDGAWASSSLSHISKTMFPQVLKNIYKSLKDKGYFYINMKKGSGEVLEPDARYGAFQKFWSFFEEEELKQLLEDAEFTILEYKIVLKTSSYHSHDVLRAFCQKA